MEMKRGFEQVKDKNGLMPVWWSSGRTLLLPKTKDLIDKKNYHPITCLNTSYKLLTDIVGKYMGENTMENNTWDEGQLRAISWSIGYC